MFAANQKFHQAAQITSRIQQSYSEYAKKFGLSYNELVVLQGLAAEETCTQTRICTVWALPRQTVNNICKKYTALGLIRIVGSGEDRREKLFALSEKGLEFALSVVEPLFALEQACIDEFGEGRADEYLALFAEFERIIRKRIGE